ncbi:MAG: tRNA 2-selenouridine(34) synthase MnmH [Aquificota bacterium]|nr:tRNA 2-selenouridine(34) synthase MnmH [Aquificota bacterium]
MSYVDIDPEQIYEFEKKVLVDIRSPQEFEEFHIPGAVNVPLFENEEKRLIGEIYRTKGEEEARKIGEKIAFSRIGKLVEEIKELKGKHENVIVYCWRGGMRSRGFCEALAKLGIRTYRLRGGYRAYRRFILRDMERILEGVSFIVLTGRTGVGKTRILRALKERGLPVIDLEGIAMDRGSVFGGVGIKRKVSQKMFDSLIYEDLRRIGGGPVFIEDESRWIGNVHIPEALWRKKEKGVYVEIKASLETRIRNILEDYTSAEGWEEEARQALYRIKKYLGPQKFGYLVERFDQGDYEEVVRFLIEEYYDRKYKQFGVPVAEFWADDLEVCVRNLEEFLKETFHEGEVQDSPVQERQKAV